MCLLFRVKVPEAGDVFPHRLRLKPELDNVCAAAGKASGLSVIAHVGRS